MKKKTTYSKQTTKKNVKEAIWVGDRSSENGIKQNSKKRDVEFFKKQEEKKELKSFHGAVQ